MKKIIGLVLVVVACVGCIGLINASQKDIETRYIRVDTIYENGKVKIDDGDDYYIIKDDSLKIGKVYQADFDTKKTETPKDDEITQIYYKTEE